MNNFSNNKIPFGMKNGILLHVSDVVSGLACGCTCPYCKAKLQANKGTSGKRVHHFSHDPASNVEECQTAFETSIHLMAKQILEKQKNVIFPLLELTISMHDDENYEYSETIEVVPKENRNFSQVELEKRLGDIRPDIIAYTSSNLPILIEIAVTHFSGSEKKEKIRKMGLHAIEIDLSKINYFITESELTKLVIDEFKNKIWLSNPDAIDAKEKLREKLDNKVREKNIELARKISSHRSKEQPFKTKQPHNETKQAIIGEINIPKQFDPRWFVCEACRNLFKKPLSEAPYSLDVIECTECGYLVSTKSV